MTKEDYLAAPGLSHSGIKDLMVSPFRYWYLHVNPDRIERPPTPEMTFGTAVHTAILEPARFDDQFARIPSEDDFPDCLRTMDDLREFIRSKGQVPKGKLKLDLIEQAYCIAECPPILDVEMEKAKRANDGKVMVAADDWIRIAGAAQALRDEPRVNEILSSGEPEAMLSMTDDRTGILLKGCADWITPTATLDVKTFAQKRQEDIDKTITQAIWREGYYRQAYMYHMLRGWPKWQGGFVEAFVESQPPHEVRLRSFHPKTGGQANLYWTRGQMEVRRAIDTYAEYQKAFGDRPWRYAQEISPLVDEEIPQLMY